MEAINSIEANQRNGNLHINIAGQFTTETALTLTTTMTQKYQGSGNIFIHTESITEVAPDSRQAFGDLMGMAILPREHIYMIGSKGLEICPDASKVIVHDKKKHKCCGRCKNCRCHEGHGHSHDHHDHDDTHKKCN
jgi:hypothetical protein